MPIWGAPVKDVQFKEPWESFEREGCQQWYSSPGLIRLRWCMAPPWRSTLPLSTQFFLCWAESSKQPQSLAPSKHAEVPSSSCAEAPRILTIACLLLCMAAWRLDFLFAPTKHMSRVWQSWAQGWHQDDCVPPSREEENGQAVRTGRSGISVARSGVWGA